MHVLQLIHGYWGILVALAALWALFRTFSGWIGRGEWLRADHRAVAAYALLFDAGALMGIALGVMRFPMLDGSAMLHGIGMLLALILLEFGRRRASRCKSSVSRHKTTCLWIALSLLLLFLSFPWGHAVFIPR